MHHSVFSILGTASGTAQALNTYLLNEGINETLLLISWFKWGLSFFYRPLTQTK